MLSTLITLLLTITVSVITVFRTEKLRYEMTLGHYNVLSCHKARNIHHPLRLLYKRSCLEIALWKSRLFQSGCQNVMLKMSFPFKADVKLFFMKNYVSNEIFKYISFFCYFCFSSFISD